MAQKKSIDEIWRELNAKPAPRKSSVPAGIPSIPGTTSAGAAHKLSGAGSSKPAPNLNQVWRMLLPSQAPWNRRVWPTLCRHACLQVLKHTAGTCVVGQALKQTADMLAVRPQIRSSSHACRREHRHTACGQIQKRTLGMLAVRPISTRQTCLQSGP
eukprot:1159565-Pelagomonas_calceolata.AAC.4